MQEVDCFMEINVGFRPDESDDGLSAKYIIFEDGKCYIRNMDKDSWDAVCLSENPDYFIEDTCNQLSHESLHRVLLLVVSPEACRSLNKVDGYGGHLLNARKVCHDCSKLIVESRGYVSQGVYFWHKKCKEASDPSFKRSQPIRRK